MHNRYERTRETLLNPYVHWPALFVLTVFLFLFSAVPGQAAPEDTQPVKTGEYNCVSYPGVGTRVLKLFREPDGTVYFSLDARNGYGKSKQYDNRDGQVCQLAGVFRQEGNRGVLDAGTVFFSHPMELKLHHRAPVKIIYHAEIVGDEIHISQNENEKTGFTEYIKLQGVYKYKETGKPLVIDNTLALYRVENLSGNAKKAGFDPRKIVELDMEQYEDAAYENTQSWRISVFTEDRRHYDYRVALNGREISKLTRMGLWLIVKDGVPFEGEIPK